MPLSSADFSAIWLTIKLASLTTVILLVIGTPIALWLSRTRSWWRGPIGAVVALSDAAPPPPRPPRVFPRLVRRFCRRRRRGGGGREHRRQQPRGGRGA